MAPMDMFEKELSVQYGSQVIPQREVEKIIQRAIDRHLIESDCPRLATDMTVSGIMDFVSQERRKFLDLAPVGTGSAASASYSGDLNFTSSIRDAHIVDKTFNAYFEYMRMTEIPVPKRRIYPWLFLLGVAILVGCYCAYTAKPY